ncbi:Ectonucleotide pyrophosphatase/phosphodiesterase family member 5 [Halotydeus destructor]|nr:Ectonucleotide pyrophosphatase/phosphodiesterase family member 5 [Halotydeus destructor]
MVVSLIQFGVVCLIATINGRTMPERKSDQLLILSFDGFRYDYYDKFKSDLTSLTSIADRGVHAPEGVKSIFHTETFPVHWTIATGLYEESHGIVGNEFFDPTTNGTFKKWTTGKEWWGGEPLWVTATRQNRSVGVYMWIGSYGNFDPYEPTARIKSYDVLVPLSTRFETIYQWLVDDRMDLVMGYWHEPDVSGHWDGPFSQGVHDKLKEIDSNLTVLLSRLDQAGVLEGLNIVVLSDHGMSQTVDGGASVYLDNYVSSKGDLAYADDAPVSLIWPNQDKQDKVRDALLSANTSATFYAKEDIPDRWHYKNSDRIPPILAVANEGYVIQKNNRSWKPFSGNHGYDNDLLSMRPIFFAAGPAFKRNYTIEEPFELVNIYTLACHLLDIEEAPNNGSLGNVEEILRDLEIFHIPESVAWAILALIALIILITIGCLCMKYNRDTKA